MDRTGLDIHDAQSASVSLNIKDSEWQHWAQLGETTSVDEFCQRWLAIQCRQIEGITGGLVLLDTRGTGPYKPTAVWPDVRNDMRHLSAAAEQSLVQRRGLLIQHPADAEANDPHNHYHVTYPLEIKEKLYGVIVLDITSRPQNQLQSVLRQLHWGSAWLNVLLRRFASSESESTLSRAMAVLNSLASMVDQKGFHRSAMTLATELATNYDCNRVSIGIKKSRRIVVKAMSHNADFAERSNLSRAVGAAMDESYDQCKTIIYPHTEHTSELPLVTRAHETLESNQGSGAICTIPLISEGKMTGAMTLERSADKPFDSETVEACESLAALAGPILEEKRLNEQYIFTKIARSISNQLKKIIGPRHVAFKLSSVTAILLTAFFIFATGDFRVSAKTIIEGEIKRVVTSPFSAYVADSKVRPGDLVKQGQILAILDDKDIRLEKLKLEGQKQQLASQYRQAMAEHDRAQIRITTARNDQINAQLDLINYKLAKTSLIAPFDGIVVTGDLSQSLGAPVEKGEVLFEVAPLDTYRIILQVDERDISHVSAEKSGKLILSSLPDKEFFFTVQTVTPVSTAREGRNYFRVEAKIEKFDEQLRPGMEGVGKIYIGQENLFWIWTYKIVNWFRLWFWSWLP